MRHSSSFCRHHHLCRFVNILDVDYQALSQQYETRLEDDKLQVMKDQNALREIVEHDSEEFARITQRIVDSEESIALWQDSTGNSYSIFLICCIDPLLILVWLPQHHYSSSLLQDTSSCRCAPHEDHDAGAEFVDGRQTSRYRSILDASN